jgi:Fe-S-cluster containining protein
VYYWSEGRYLHDENLVTGALFTDKTLYQERTLMPNSDELIEWNKQHAYEGNLGHERELFCIKYLREKNKVIKEVEESQARETSLAKKPITCKKGCNFSTCCMEFIEATIQECEIIVYYLYKHPQALSQFLKNYPGWKEKALPDSGIINEFNQIYGEISATKVQKSKRMFEELEKRLFELHIRYFDHGVPCPFLVDSNCLIYDVRPYVCVIAYSNSPQELCKINNNILPPINRSLLPEDTYYIPLFYYGKLDIPNPLLMASNVYDILVKGYAHIAEVTCLHGLLKEAKSQNLLLGD